MGFSTKVADEVLVRCNRHCCLCDKFAGTKIELHHIRQKADGGDDSIDNCIPLCLDCHAEVKAYNPNHPKGRQYTENELKAHRDKCYAKYSLDSQSDIDYYENYKTIFLKKKTHILKWNDEELEDLCTIRPGNLIMIAGYSGSGKSEYIHNIIHENIKNRNNVAYCCIKDNTFDVGLEFIAESVGLDKYRVKNGSLTENDYNIIGNDKLLFDNKLALIPYNKSYRSEDIINIIENSNANIIVIDDLNGIRLKGDETMESFLYNLRSVSNINMVTVIAVFNLVIPNRCDKHPIKQDFPSDCYYRLFNIVHLIFNPRLFDEYSECEYSKEIVVIKGGLGVPFYIRK